MFRLISGKKDQFSEGLEDMDPKERKKEIMKRKKMSGLANSDKLSRLEKVELEQKGNKLNKPFKATEDFKGPIEKRKATDKWWLLAIGFAVLFLLIHGVIVYLSGRTYRLYSGLDFRSLPCGRGNLTELKYLYFPIANVNSNITMCIDKCPDETGHRLCLYHPDGVTKHEGDAFCYTSIQTTYDGRYCIPREQKTKLTVDTWVYNWENVYRRALGDLSLTIDLTVLAYAVEILVLILTLFLLSFRKSLSCCVWISIILCINALNLMALFCYFEYLKTIKRRCYDGLDRNSCGGARANLFWTLIFVFLGIGLVYLIAVLFLCRKLMYMIEALKDSIYVFKGLRQNKLNILIGTTLIMKALHSM